MRTFFSKVKNYFLTRKYIINRFESFEKRIVNQNVISFLQRETLKTEERGTTDDRISTKEIVVSLTSYGKRLKKTHLAIESIMQGSMKPNRIILWLQNDLQNEILPITLQNQIKRGLEVRYCSDIRSYKKLIPTLKLCPEAAIITIDDDLIYNHDLIENLVNAYNKDETYVYATRMHRMCLDSNSRPLLYALWDYCTKETEPSVLNFLTGGGGTLYPPHVFPNEVFEENVFMSICRNADDVWFNAMLLLNNKLIKRIETLSHDGEEYFELEDDQQTGLKYFNTDVNRTPRKCANDEQLERVFEHYQLYEKLK